MKNYLLITAIIIVCILAKWQVDAAEETNGVGNPSEFMSFRPRPTPGTTTQDIQARQKVRRDTAKTMRLPWATGNVLDTYAYILNP